MILELQKDIIYGPINSRRLGKSLGINLMPTSYKLCSFNCIYCHYGNTKILARNLTPYLKDLPTPTEVKLSLEKYLNNSPEIDYITFSGNGEPTLHPQFHEIVEIVKEIRDMYLPYVKLALLSNSTFLNSSKMINSLNKIDLRIFKLDAGTENLFLKLNRPYKEIKFEEIIRNLKNIKDYVVQTVFLAGEINNSSGESVNEWIKKLKEINPKEVQIYTIDRPTANKRLIKVSKERLNEIKNEVIKTTGIKITVY
jgi:wyosine [tRNA(Phe)-imidazoG37] synthetase (radical SAM superfamily)